MTDASLKKLNFVPVYGTKGYNLATTAYSSAKGRLPAPVKDKLSSFEETVSEVTAPYIVKAQDKGSEILKIVDDQVCVWFDPTDAWVGEGCPPEPSAPLYSIRHFVPLAG